MKELKRAFWVVKYNALRTNTLSLFLLLMMFLDLSCAKPRYVSQITRSIMNIQSGCELFLQTENVCLRTRWVIAPTEDQEGEMIVEIVDFQDDERKIDPIQTFFVKLWMPSMSHGSSPVKLTRLDVGVYRASEIFFIMGGEWEIRFQLRNGKQVLDEAKQNIKI